MLLRINESLKLQLVEQTLNLEVSSLDDLDSERLTGDLVRRLHSCLADFLDQLVLTELAGEAFDLHNLPHQALSAGLVRHEQLNSLFRLCVHAADRIEGDGRIELLPPILLEAQFCGWWFERDQHFAEIYSSFDDLIVPFVLAEM